MHKRNCRNHHFSEHLRFCFPTIIINLAQINSYKNSLQVWTCLTSTEEERCEGYNTLLSSTLLHHHISLRCFLASLELEKRGGEGRFKGQDSSYLPDIKLSLARLFFILESPGALWKFRSECLLP